jgi:thymidylate synthase (FAD)
MGDATTDPAARLVFVPDVYVISRPSLDSREVMRFIEDTGFPDWRTDGQVDAQIVTEVAARLCYRSFGKGRPHREHIAHLIAEGHLSTFEHCQWTLLVTGVSRTLTHELVRHRHLSYSQESQRYVDASGVRFVVPPDDVGEARDWLAKDCPSDDREPTSRWYFANMIAVNEYTARVRRYEARGYDRKRARSAARSVLPGCCETRICVSGNARAFREVLAKRLAPGADVEFRRLAGVIRNRLAAEAPDLFAGV